MSGTENGPAGTLEGRLRIGAGFAAADRRRILGALSALAPHLSGWEHDRVDLEVSLKDTHKSAKSTSASAPARCVCGTSASPSCRLDSARISERRLATWSRTVE